MMRALRLGTSGLLLISANSRSPTNRNSCARRKKHSGSGKSYADHCGPGSAPGGLHQPADESACHLERIASRRWPVVAPLLIVYVSSYHNFSFVSRAGEG